LGLVVLAGSPGTGKSSIAKAIEELGLAEVVDVARLALERELVTEYDFEREAHVVDLKKLEKAAEEAVEAALARQANVLVVTMMPCVAKKLRVDGVVVLRTSAEELRRRLLERGWKAEKVEENVEAEELGVVKAEALECFGGDLVVEVDTTSREGFERALEAVKSLLRRGAS